MDTLFGLINLLPLPVWVMMLLFPRHPLTQRLVLSPWPFVVLAAVYALLLAGAAFVSPAAWGWSLPALQGLMASDAGFLAVWAHLLTLDLFAGVWLFRDAKYWGINPGLFLLATLLAGPLGLGAYLLWRRRSERNDPVRLLN